MTHKRICRSCGAPLEHTLVDLGVMPLSNHYISPAKLDDMEPFYPMVVRICTTCWLAQLPSLVRPEHLFADYAYFSSYSDSWLAHSRRYVEAMIQRWSLRSRPRGCSSIWWRQASSSHLVRTNGIMRCTLG